MFVILFVLVVLLILFLSWFSYYLDKKHNDVKGPSPYPIIGNGHLLAVDSAEFLRVLRRLEDEYDKTTLIYILSKRYIATSDPKFIEEIVSSTKLIDKGRSYDFVRPWLGDGLLTSSGSRWKAHRKFLTPAFHFNILQQYLPIFCKNAKILSKKLHRLSGKSSLDMFPIIALAALDNVTESIMAVTFNAQEDSESEFVKAVERMSSIISMRMRNPFMALNFLFNLTPYKSIQEKSLKILHDQTWKIIHAREKQLKENKISELTLHSEHGIKNKHTFLDLLLLAEVDGKRISSEWVREEVDTFLFEGHDTTTSGITYCLYNLAKYQEIQEKVYEEQKSLFLNDFDRDILNSDLNEMKYLDLVIKESLRLYPSVPLIERKVVEDTVIKGLKVPKDTSLVIDFINMQRDPSVFEDPLEFRPERFANSGRDPFSWLPFSAGPRNCIGQKFAMMEMKVTLSEIVRNFKLLPTGQEPELGADLILRSRNGVKLKIMPRS